MLMRLNVFFFSSRRRHTRSKRDWSSDVCSSDLQTGKEALAKYPADPGIRTSYALLLGENERSEERRVGKECRTRSSPYPQTKTPSAGFSNTRSYQLTRIR